MHLLPIGIIIDIHNKYDKIYNLYYTFNNGDMVNNKLDVQDIDNITTITVQDNSIDKTRQDSDIYKYIRHG